jgi:hypothetical protein
MDWLENLQGTIVFPFPHQKKRPSAVCFSLETNPMKHGEIRKKVLCWELKR